MRGRSQSLESSAWAPEHTPTNKRHNMMSRYELPANYKTHEEEVCLRLVRRKWIKNLDRNHKIVLDVSAGHQKIRMKGREVSIYVANNMLLSL